MERIAKLLTDQFYTWEQRGRGTLLADAPSQLEPPFHPFFYHAVSTPYIDDGRRPTMISTVFDFIKGKQPPAIQTPLYEEPPIQPFMFVDGELHAFTIVIPKNFKTPSEPTIQVLIMLANCAMPLSYEIHGTYSAISIHLVCRKEDCLLVRGQFKAYFPDVTLHDDAAYIEKSLPHTTKPAIVDFVLHEEFTRPIQTARGFDFDPYISFFGILEQLQYGENVLFQIQFTAAKNAWAKSILSSVTTYRGECFFIDAPEMLPLAREKVSMPLYAVAIKLSVQAASVERVYQLVSKSSDAISMASRSASNELQVRDDDAYLFEERLYDISERQSHRLGMLLNARELATFVHFPSQSIHSDKLLRLVTRTKAAPASVKGHNHILGKNIHQNQEVSVSLSEAQRMRHVHIIGATGTGKSTLMLNMMQQDIAQHNGFAVIDPHGDVVDTVLSMIPTFRQKDVVLIDPFDTEYPVACNILHAKTDIERELISSDLVALFKRFSTSWGDQMNSVFANAILAFVESTKGGTLLDLRQFLIEKPFRDSFLQTVQDPQIVYYWQKEFPLLKSSSIGPILTKLDAFLRPKVIRNMVSQKQSLPFAEFMDTKKIVLIKLSQGLIGAENSYLLGALLVSKFHQTAMARQLQHKDNRIPFYLYIDEFQHFITPSMSDMLSGVRKYQLGLVLGHQGMEQVSKYDNELAHALLANAGTRICFRLGNADAKKMEEGFSYFKADDLQNLGIGEAIVRVNRAEDDFSLRIQQQSFATNSENEREKIIDLSRKKYATQLQAFAQQPSNLEPAPVVIQAPAVTQPSSSKAPFSEQQKEYIEPKTKSKQSEGDAKKEQSEHRSLQMLIKMMAESRGFKASLEVPTGDGGKVDVVLEKDGLKIACEVSVTTDISWELHNMQKCLKASFTTIFSVSKDERYLSTFRKKIQETYTEQERRKIQVLSPEKLFEYFDGLNKPKDELVTVKGYRVKVAHANQSGAVSDTKNALIKDLLSRNKK